jgi:hypothetical protein
MSADLSSAVLRSIGPPALQLVCDPLAGNNDIRAGCPQKGRGRASATKHDVGMPLKRFAGGLRESGQRQPDFSSIQGVVVPPVLELLADATTHTKSILRCDRDVPTIKERMKVRPEEKTVRDLVPLHDVEGLDMSRL